MRNLPILLLILFFLGCADGHRAGPGSEQTVPASPVQAPSKPASPPVAAPPAVIMSREECVAAGGRFRPSLGDQAVTCEPDEAKIADVAFGIEGGVCCR